MSTRAEEYDDYEEYEPYCGTCQNEGWVVTCMDDLCRNNGSDPGLRCIHGDGEILCPNPKCEADPW